MSRKGKFDYKEFKQLADKLQKFTDAETNKFAEACAKELAARLLRKVIQKTPVGDYLENSGKKGGTLRRGWTADSDKQAMYSAMFKATPTKITDYVNDLKITKNGNMLEIEIVNPVEYSEYVENGHRSRSGGWVEGKFMLKISCDEIEQTAPKILENKLNKMLKEVFK